MSQANAEPGAMTWAPIEELPANLKPGCSFLFCTIAKHVSHVTLVRAGDTLCWATDRSDAQPVLLLDRDMAMVTHFAEPVFPEPSEHQLTAVAIRVANLDGRGLAYEHEPYAR